MPGNSSTPPRSVARKVMSLLDAFSDTDRELSLNELARLAALPLSTTYRLATDLVDWGGLERVDGGGYRIGLRLWEIGILAPRGAELREVAVPYMQDLHQATRENVQLAVVHGREALYIEKIAGRHPAATLSRRGGRLPLHATGAGKALLAYAPRELLEEVIGAGLARYTPHTIVVPGRLRAHLSEVRRTGVAFARDELTLGSVSVAAPLVGPDGIAIAAISVVARSNATDLRRLAPAVRAAAQCASQQLREQHPATSTRSDAGHRPA